MFGSTVATNALAQRRLARVGLLATAGFRDLLDIRRLWRPRLFGHDWDRPAALVPRALRLEVRGRLDPTGAEVEPLDERDVEAAADAFADGGRRGRRHRLPARVRERRPRAARGRADRGRAARRARAAVVRREPGAQGVRADVDDRRSPPGSRPVIDRALGTIEDTLREAGPAARLPRHEVERRRDGRARPPASGRSSSSSRARPAACRRGCTCRRRSGEPNLILLDIGGTTADVSVLADGHATRADHDSVEWDIPIRVPVVEIRSIGAGGGSLIGIDAAGALSSRAASRPAPSPARPRTVGAARCRRSPTPRSSPAGSIRRGSSAARCRSTPPRRPAPLQPVADALGQPLARAAAAALQFATAEMATLVRELTVERGHDPRSFALVAFGGAGPLFLGTAADRAGAAARLRAQRRRRRCRPRGGAVADVVVDEVRTESDPDRIAAGLAALIEPRAAGDRRGGPADARDPHLGRRALRRPVARARDRARAGRAVHGRRGPVRGRARAAVRAPPARSRTSSWSRCACARWPRRRSPRARQAPALPAAGPRTRRTIELYGSGALDVPVYDRATLGPGTVVDGPLVVEEADTTLVLGPGQSLAVTPSGVVEVHRG